MTKGTVQLHVLVFERWWVYDWEIKKFDNEFVLFFLSDRQQSPVVGMQIDGESEIQGPAAKYDMHSIQEVGSKETQDSDSYGEIILLRESKILTTSENTLIDTTRFQSENHSFLNYELQEASVSHRVIFLYLLIILVIYY